MYLIMYLCVVHDVEAHVYTFVYVDINCLIANNLYTYVHVNIFQLPMLLSMIFIYEMVDMHCVYEAKPHVFFALSGALMAF